MGKVLVNALKSFMDINKKEFSSFTHRLSFVHLLRLFSCVTLEALEYELLHAAISNMGLVFAFFLSGAWLSRSDKFYFGYSFGWKDLFAFDRPSLSPLLTSFDMISFACVCVSSFFYTAITLKRMPYHLNANAICALVQPAISEKLCLAKDFLYRH